MSGPVDICIVGGGIAGAAAAFELAPRARVVILEQESQCGYHATGRSAASFTENYGPPLVRRLAMCSRAFLESPPSGFADHPLLTGRGMITVARKDQLDVLETELARARALVPSIDRLPVEEALARVPVLRPDYVAGTIFEPHSRDVDVHGLLHGFLKGMRARGGQVATGARVDTLSRRSGRWVAETTAGRFEADIVINAAGAWADEIAVVAGARPIGLVPKRRTAFNVDPPAGMQVHDWPLVNDVGGEFYFKPDAGRLLISPADETPSAPTDAQPEDLDVAIGVERVERAATLAIRRITHKWAGLRTFTADGRPVAGMDPDRPGFFWLAGQGGYGVKTSSALGRATAGLVLDGALPDDLAARGIEAAELSPARFRIHS